MAKKTKLLKNLLTTASALAVISSGAQTAFGAIRTTTNNNWDLTGTEIGGAAAVDKDTIKINADGHTAGFYAGGTAGLSLTFDLTSRGAADYRFSIDTANALTLSGVINSATVNAKFSIDVANAAAKLKLAAADIVFHEVKLGAAASELIIDQKNKYTFDVDGGAASQGVVTISRGGQLTGNIGATHRVASLTFGAGGGKVIGTVAATQLSVTAASTDEVEIGGDVTVDTGGVGIDGDAAVTFGGGLGVTAGGLDIKGASGNVTVAGDTNVTVGGVTIGGGRTTTFTKATTVTAGGVTIGGTGTTTFGALTIGNGGDLTVAGTATTVLTGALNVAGELKVGAATGAKVNTGADQTFAVTYNQDNGVLTLSGTGARRTITGNVGFNGKTGAVLTLSGIELTGTVDGGVALGGGTINIGSDSKIRGKVGNTVEVKQINLTAGGSVFDLAVKAKDVSVQAGADAKFSENLTVSSGTLLYAGPGSVTIADTKSLLIGVGVNKAGVDFRGQDGTLVIENGANVGLIDNTDGGGGGANVAAGTITINQGFTATAAIGNLGKVKKIDIGATAGGNVTIAQTVKAEELKFTTLPTGGAGVNPAATSDIGTINLNGKDATMVLTGTTVGSVVTGTNDIGIITLSGASVITGGVGEDTKALKQLTLQDASELRGAVFIKAANGLRIDSAGGPADVKISGDVKIGGGAATDYIKFIGADGKLTITGATLTGGVNFDAQAGAELVLTAANVSGNIVTTGTPGGVITIGGGSTITGTVGANGNRITTINLENGGSTFANTVYAQDISVKAGADVTFSDDVSVVNLIKYAGDGSVTIAATKTLSAVDFNQQDGKLIVKNGATLAAIDNKGVIAGTITIDQDATFNGQIGNTKEVKLIEVGNDAAAAGTVTFVQDVKAGSIKFTNKEATLNFTENISAAVDFNNKGGTIVLQTAKTLTGSIISTGAVAGSRVGSLKGQDLRVTGAISGIDLIEIGTNGGAAAPSTFGGAIDVDKLQFANNATGVAKVVFNEGVKFNEAIDIKNKNVEIELADGKSLSITTGDDAFIDSANLKLTFLGDGSLDKSIKNADTITFSGGGKQVTFTGDLYRSTNFKFGNANATLNLNKDGMKLEGDFSGAAANQGIIKVSQSASIKGTIGATTIQQISIAADKTLTFVGNSIKTSNGAGDGIIFTGSSTLTIAPNAGTGVTIDAPITVASNSDGKIDATSANVQNLTFAKSIGADIKALGSVVTGRANQVTFNGSTYLKSLTLGDARSLEFIAAVGGDTFGLGEIQFSGDSTKSDVTFTNGGKFKAMGAGLSFGAKDKRIKDFVVNGADLEVDGDVSIFAANIKAGGKSIEFKGTGTLDAAFDNGSLIGDFTAGAQSKTFTVVQDFKAANILVGQGTLVFQGNVEATVDIKASAAGGGKGTLKFANDREIKVTANNGTNVIGNVNSFESIEFAGAGKVTFLSEIAQGNKQKLVFSSSAADQTIVLANAQVASDNPIEVTGGKAVSIQSKSGLTLTGSVTGAANGKVTFVSTAITGQTYTVISDYGSAQIRGLDDAAAGNTSVTLNKGAKLWNIGGVNTFNTVIFAGNSEVTSGVRAKTITVNLGAVATVGDVVDGETTIAGTLNLLEGASLVSIVKAGAAGQGTLSTTGVFTVRKAIGTQAAVLGAVNFGKGSKNDDNVYLEDSVYANTIDAREVTLTPTLNPITLSGTVSAKALDVSTTSITNNGQLTLEGDVLLSAGIEDLKAKGTISTGVLDLSGVKGITLNLRGDVNGSPLTNISGIKILTNAGALNGGVKEVSLTFDVPITLVKWEASMDNKGNVFVTRKDNVVSGLTEALGKDIPSTDIANIDPIKDSEEVLNQLANMTPDEQKDAIRRLPANTTTTGIVADVAAELSSDLSGRLSSLAGTQVPSADTRLLASTDTIGAAAGDEASRYGVWFTPSYTNGAQKMRKSTAGYKVASTGATIGFDTKANEDMIIGMGLSLYGTEAKHKDYKAGDKTKITSYMVSVYGVQQITSNWFTQGIVTIGSNRIDSKEKRLVATGGKYQIASAKYDSMSASGELMLGYTHFMKGVSITPMAGLRVAKVNDGGYRETGTTGQNLVVSKKEVTRFEGVFGARVAAGTFNLNGLVVTPEVHGSVSHDFVNKKPGVDMRLEAGTKALVANSTKPSKTAYNMGAGLNASYANMEYGVSYDARVADKYLAHQGTLKVRVNF